MYVTTNSALVWKRMADENQHSARLMARISVGLLVLMVLTGVYAFSTHLRYSALCSSVRDETATSDSLKTQQRGNEIITAYCS